jgi:hypothetical protein
MHAAALVGDLATLDIIISNRGNIHLCDYVCVLLSSSDDSPHSMALLLWTMLHKKAMLSASNTSSIMAQMSTSLTRFI